MIALRAADEAALGIVEARLAVVAVGGCLARDVRAVLVRGPVLPEPQRSEQKHERTSWKERGRRVRIAHFRSVDADEVVDAVPGAGRDDRAVAGGADDQS